MGNNCCLSVLPEPVIHSNSPEWHYRLSPQVSDPVPMDVDSLALIAMRLKRGQDLRSFRLVCKDWDLAVQEHVHGLLKDMRFLGRMRVELASEVERKLIGSLTPAGENISVQQECDAGGVPTQYSFTYFSHETLLTHACRLLKPKQDPDHFVKISQSLNSLDVEFYCVTDGAPLLRLICDRFRGVPPVIISTATDQLGPNAVSLHIMFPSAETLQIERFLKGVEFQPSITCVWGHILKELSQLRRSDITVIGALSLDSSNRYVKELADVLEKM